MVYRARYLYVILFTQGCYHAASASKPSDTGVRTGLHCGDEPPSATTINTNLWNKCDGCCGCFRDCGGAERLHP